jgi:hypothetical protein
VTHTADYVGHLMEGIDSDFIDGLYVAACSCGWVSEGFNFQDEALNDWQSHKAEASLNDSLGAQ